MTISTGTLHSARTYPAFATLLLGTVATNTGYWMYLTAVGWLALQMTGSALFVGLAGFAGGIPMLLLGLPAGVILDRSDRRRVLMLAQGTVMVVASLFAVMEAAGALRPWSLLALAFCYGSGMSFIFPTRTTIVPSLVGRADLANAIALNSAVQNATRVVGPALAGVLIALISATGTFGITVLLQILAVFTTTRLPAVASGGRRAISDASGLMGGVQAILANPFLVGLILLSLATNVLVMPYINLMPVFTRQVLGMGATGLGVLLAVAGLGSVAGALAVARSGRLISGRGIQIVTAVGFTLFVLLFTTLRHEILAAPVLFAAGFMSAAFMALNQTTLQLSVDDARRGRVLSIYLLTWGMLPFGQLAIGAFAGAVGAPEALAIACGLSLVAIALIVWRIPSLRAARTTRPPEIIPATQPQGQGTAD